MTQATMQDVARLAGVSSKTVSNVINDRPYVSAETRDRVEKAITQLGYKLNLAARNLRSGRSGVIGLAVPSLSVAYFAELAEATVGAAEQHGLVVQIERTGSLERERALLASPRLQHIDGLILNPMDHTAEELESVRLALPTVVLGDHPVGGAAVHISTDQRAAAALATEQLLLTGRRRIAAIGARHDDRHGSAGLRFEGYRSVIERAGGRIDPALIVEADPLDPARRCRGDEGAAAARRGVRRRLRLQRQSRARRDARPGRRGTARAGGRRGHRHRQHR